MQNVKELNTFLWFAQLFALSPPPSVLPIEQSPSARLTSTSTSPLEQQQHRKPIPNDQNVEFLQYLFLRYVWPLNHLICIIGLMAIIYMERNEMFHSTSTIGKFLDVIQVLVPIIAHLIMIIEGAFNKHQNDKLLIKLHQLNGQIEIHCDHSIVSNCCNDYMHHTIVKLMLTIFVAIGSEICIIAAIYKVDYPWTRSWVIRIWSLSSIHYSNFILIMFIDFITCRLLILNVDLEQYRSTVYSTTVGNTIDSILRAETHLREIKRIHNELRKFRFILNERFNFSILITIINYFISLTIAFYFIVSRFYFFRLDSIMDSISVVIAPIVMLSMIVQSGQNCKSEFDSLARKFHELNFYVNDGGKPSRLVQEILQQTIQISDHVSGYGFFQLDHKFLVAMVASITSYLVLAISMNGANY